MKDLSDPLTSLGVGTDWDEVHSLPLEFSFTEETLMVKVVTKYGAYEISLDRENARACREAVKVVEVEKRTKLDISPLEAENLALRLMLYDFAMGQSKIEDLGPDFRKRTARCASCKKVYTHDAQDDVNPFLCVNCREGDEVAGHHSLSIRTAGES